VREAELLNALACHDPGVEVHLDSKRAAVTALYKPPLRGHGKTLFYAAFDLAKQMYQHPDCPPDVDAALEAYDNRTNILAL